MKSVLRKKILQKGFGLVEAVTSAMFIIVAVVLSLDCWFMITAAHIADAACRDAARAAAQAGDSNTATNAAMAAVQPYSKYGNNMMTAPTVTVTYNDAGSPPSVTVLTTCSVTPLIPLSVLGSSFNGMNFSQQYSFPLIRTMSGVTAQNITSPGGSGNGSGNGSGGDNTTGTGGNSPPQGDGSPPAGGGPPAGSGPPAGDGPPTGSGPPAGDGPPTGSGPPAGDGPPSGSGPPAGSGPPVGGGPVGSGPPAGNDM